MSDGPLGGLLLAGGRATRFGGDKALAVVDGVTLLDRAEACLRATCDGPVLVASGDGASRPGVGDGQVTDLVADGGPLSALGAGLSALAGRGCAAAAVLAVDHVAPSTRLLTLLAAHRGAAACAVAEVGGRLQPLHAVWSTEAAQDVTAAVARGERSVLAWLSTRDDVVVLGQDVLLEAGVALSAVRDVDRPEDLPG